MVAVGHSDKVFKTAGILQCLGEILALAIWHHRVSITMDDEELRVFLVDIRHRVHGTNHVGILCRRTAYDHSLRRIGVLVCLATLHTAHVDRSKPIHHCIHGTALTGVLSELSLDIHLHLSKLACLHSIGCSCQGREMTAGGISRNADERSI